MTDSQPVIARREATKQSHTILLKELKAYNSIAHCYILSKKINTEFSD